MIYPAEPLAAEPLQAEPWWAECSKGHYRLYRGVGRPEAIDWDTPVGISPAGVAQVVLAALGHEAGVEYFYGVRAVSDAGVEEFGTAAVCRVLVDELGNLVSAAPNRLSEAKGQAVADGQIAVTFEYDATDEAGIAANVEIALVGVDGPDWENPLEEVAIEGSCRRRIVMEQAFADGETVRLAARATTAAGVGGPVALLEPVVADAVGPEVVHGIRAEMI